MPIYRYECCGREWEESHSIDERRSEICPTCHSPAVLLPPTRILTFKSYYDRALGQNISSPMQKSRLLKQHDLIEVGTELKHIPETPDTPAYEHHLPTQREFDEKVREVKERFPSGDPIPSTG